MAGTTVVVAIPRDDDPVWKYSSEEVPHLTLLSLGDQSDNPKLGEMGEYLSHAAATMLHTFGFSVDRRGTLGPKNADVLFFEKDNRVMKMLEEFRRGVLADSAFFETYITSDQFPEWIPHLTMGFPETPAKEVDDEDNHPGTLNWVEFDRIAIWPGDYAGPEYRLKREHYMDLAMSESSAEFLAHHGVKSPAKEIKKEDTFGEATLRHYGVKGMKWGRRKDEGLVTTPVVTSHTPGSRVKASGGTAQPASDDAKQAAASRQLARASTTDALSNKELQSLVTRLNLEQQYSRLTAQPPSAMQKGKQFIFKQLKDPNSRRNLQKTIGQSPGVKYYKDVKAVGDAISKVKL